ncbi:Kelch motif [Rhizoctonia solani]|uniref:Kelch motif n=1 Tax=Rhizoctonia solani TaxID=456999 RepID=A0A8H7IEH6_9AGAM|nr:Kelch motif [Rhizoctonia solani]
MASFFSRKRHTAQPPAAPQPQSQAQPQPQPPPTQTQSTGSIGRNPAPPRPQPPPQSLQQQPHQHTPDPLAQQQQQQQPQQPPSSSGHVQTPSQSGGSSRPRQDYPWSVRRLQVEGPMRVPGGTTASVTSMTGPPLPRYGHSVPLVATPGGDIFVFGDWSKTKSRMTCGCCAVHGVQMRDQGGQPRRWRRSQSDGDHGRSTRSRVGHKSALVSSVLIVWGGDTLAKEGERNDDGLYLLNLSQFILFSAK